MELQAMAHDDVERRSQAGGLVDLVRIQPASASPW